jgi:hypothetical protein
LSHIGSGLQHFQLKNYHFNLMKKSILGLLVFVLVALTVTSAQFSKPEKNLAGKLKKQCFGYTIVEAGKGVDCYGDTVALVKRHGFYQMASLRH